MYLNKRWKTRISILSIGMGLLSIFYVQSCTNSQAGMANNTLPEKVDFNFHIKPILSDRCFTCHGPDENQRKAKLRLDTKEGAFNSLKDDPEKWVIKAGESHNSDLIARIFEEDPESIMPPPESNLTLSKREKELIKRWVDQGAEWKDHWAFTTPVRPELPSIKTKGWPTNEIDYFILSRLETEQLAPESQAEAGKLLRRISLDITGLPPTLEELESFTKDDSPQAYEKAVDALLAKEAFGEKMASIWLDVARYADSHGYQDDLERTMWPWRDWVIKAYNENMPFDTFTLWQLAGDLLENPTPEQILATGFNRNHMITQEGGVIDEEYRVEYVADRTNTTSKAFMGLTMECARCHDHKYDPLTQKQYYEMFAFFNSVPEKGNMGYGAVPAPKMELTEKETREALAFIKDLPTEGSVEVLVMEDMEKPRTSYILNRGAYDAHGEEVSPAMPENLMAFGGYEKNRLGLAKWLTHPDHPLTARVMVNRLWLMIFGSGLVSTPADFGNQGALPTHPELLDWLAVEFVESGWDTKAMIKKMVMSSTYRQSSNFSPEKTELDPDNMLLAHGPRYRLSAETIRDQVLEVSGLLVKKTGGPSVKPYQPDGLWAETTSGQGLTKYIPDEGDGLYRKSLYTFWKRTVPPPSMMIFDATSRNLCEVERQATSTPLQALVLLNDPQYVEAARFFADRLIREGGDSFEERINYAFQLLISRNPSKEEIELLSNFFKNQESRFQTDPELAQEFLDVGESPVDESLDLIEMAAYTMVASSLFNLDEAVSKT